MTGEKRLSIKQWGKHEKKKKATREQNESKKAAVVQSAALLRSVALSTVLASDVLNSVNHTRISSWLRPSMSALSWVLKMTGFWLTLTVCGWATTLDLLLHVVSCVWIYSSHTLWFLVEKLKYPFHELMFVTVFSLLLRLNSSAYIPKYQR